MDESQKTLAASETRIEPPVQTLTTTNPAQVSAAERYVATRDEIEHSILSDRAREMIVSGNLPDIAHDKGQTLTVKDLLSQEAKDAAHSQARELSWQSFEPQELKDAAAGRAVEERLVTTADQVMDRVATAQTLEQQLASARDSLKTFVNDQLARAEQPIKDGRAASAYENTFRDVLQQAREEARLPIDGEPHESTRLLESLDRGTPTASLVTQAETQQLPSIEQNLVIEAHNSATLEAQVVQQQSLYLSHDERDAAQQQILSELSGSAATQQSELRTTLSQLETKFEQSFNSIDEKLGELAEIRLDVQIGKELAQFQEIAKPAAAAINNYLKETVREEGFRSLFEPLRHEEHVERISQAIIESAAVNNVSLDHSAASLEQVSQIAGSLFDTLSLNLEHLNQPIHFAEMTQNFQMPSHLMDQSQTLSLAGNNLGAMGPNGNHDQLAMLNNHHEQHQHPLLPGQNSTQFSERDITVLDQTQAASTLSTHESTALGGHTGTELALEQTEAVLAL